MVKKSFIKRKKRLYLKLEVCEIDKKLQKEVGELKVKINNFETFSSHRIVRSNQLTSSL